MATLLSRLVPVGWVVESAKGRALVLERPNADALAARVHGTVDTAYSGAQVALLLQQQAALEKPTQEGADAAA